MISMFAMILANMVLFSCSEHENALVLPDVQIEVSEHMLAQKMCGGMYG